MSEPSSPLALLIPLRFEFANEFGRWPMPNEVGPDGGARLRSAAIRYRKPAGRAAFPPRSDAQSRQERGRPAAGHPSRTCSNRVAPSINRRPESPIATQARTHRFVRYILIAIAEKTGRPEYRSIRTAQFFRKRLFCQTNLLQALPAGASRVASIRRHVTHRIEGGSQSEGPGSGPSWRHALITANGKRPQKYAVPGVIEVSSTGTSARSHDVI